MSDRETLEDMLGYYTLMPQKYRDAIRAVLEDNERLRAIKRSDTEMIEECRKELAELANNRDELEHDWSERGARIDAALALYDAAMEIPPLAERMANALRGKK